MIRLSSCECHLFFLVFMCCAKALDIFARSSLCSSFDKGDFSSGSASTLNSNGGSKNSTVPSSALTQRELDWSA